MTPKKAAHVIAAHVIENVLFAGGGLMLLAITAEELADRAGLLPHAKHSFPLVMVIMSSVLVVPKFLGRATGGAIWTALADRIRGRRAGGAL